MIPLFILAKNMYKHHSVDKKTASVEKRGLHMMENLAENFPDKTFRHTAYENTTAVRTRLESMSGSFRIGSKHRLSGARLQRRLDHTAAHRRFRMATTIHEWEKW